MLGSVRLGRNGRQYKNILRMVGEGGAEKNLKTYS